MKELATINLGRQGLVVPLIGLGCMGMTKIAHMDIYGPADEREAIATIHRSLELGGNFLDTADLYGPVLNEQLIAKAINGNRDKYILATKFGYEINDNDELTWQINGSKAYVKKAAERSLVNLGTDYIDLYYLHRLDPNTPIEETMEAMADLVKEGKVGYVGLSEVSSKTIVRAHAVHPLTAIQSEYSLVERSVEEEGIIETLQNLGIGFVAYSPLGRGFFAGNIHNPDDFPETDFRKSIPKYQGQQFYKNAELRNKIKEMADSKNITTIQLALAWVIAKGFVPIPGTKKIKYIEQNMEATRVTLTLQELTQLEEIIPLGTLTGDRYDAANMAVINQ